MRTCLCLTALLALGAGFFGAVAVLVAPEWWIAAAALGFGTACCLFEGWQKQEGPPAGLPGGRRP